MPRVTEPMGRYVWMVAACIALILLLAGCGSSGPSKEADAPYPSCSSNMTLLEYKACVEQEIANGREEEPKAADAEPSEEAGGPLSYVGTIKASDGAGTIFTDRYRLGPLSYGEEAPPPPAVLNACGVNSPSEAAASVFARGQISVTYSEGSLPEDIAIGEEGTVQGEGVEGVLQVASLVDGEWQCLGQEEGSGLEIEPNETMSFPIWLVGDLVLSNSRPRLPPEVLNSLHLYPVGGYALAGTTPGDWKISGPGAASCDGEPRLLLYGRPPVRMPSHPPYGGIICQVP